MNSNDKSPPPRINHDRLSHAYIAEGRLADTLAMAAVCSGRGTARPCMACAHCSKSSRNIHPDITAINRLPDKREILVDQVRELKRDVVVVPNEAEKKAYIINDADTMNSKAQNALLQILEEPPPHVMFVLRTDNPAALLPTVRSRCIEAKSPPGAAPADAGEAHCPAGAGELEDEFFSALERGNIHLAAFMFKLEKLDKTALAAFLEAAREQSAERLRASMPRSAAAPSEMLARVERILARAGEMLEFNVNSGHISALICASLMEPKN